MGKEEKGDITTPMALAVREAYQRNEEDDGEQREENAGPDSAPALPPTYLGENQAGDQEGRHPRGRTLLEMVFETLASQSQENRQGLVNEEEGQSRLPTH